MTTIHVPEAARIFFDKAWREGNCLIPVDRTLRAELKRRMEYFIHSGAMHMVTDEEAKNAILARYAALEAYDEALFKARRKNQVRAAG